MYLLYLTHNFEHYIIFNFYNTIVIEFTRSWLEQIQLHFINLKFAIPLISDSTLTFLI